MSKAWSENYSCCIKCGTTTIPFLAKGLCKKCYYQERKRKFQLKGKRFCECGCGTEIPLLTTEGKPMRFYPGHNFKKNGSRIQKTCPVCGKIFEVYKSDSPRMICCSTKCSAEQRKIKDRKVDNQGYVVVPGYTIGRTRREHRIIMENHLGRKLSRNEHVHHIDGNKTNNAIDNLMVVNASDHLRYHLKKSGYRKGLPDNVLQL